MFEHVYFVNRHSGSASYHAHSHFCSRAHLLGCQKGLWLKLHIPLPVHMGYDPICNACEMAVVWMQNQLAKNKTQELILNYINQVCLIVQGIFVPLSTLLYLTFHYDSSASVYLVPWENQPWSVPVFGSMPNIVFTIGGKKLKLKPKQVWSLLRYHTLSSWSLLAQPPPFGKLCTAKLLILALTILYLCA